MKATPMNIVFPEAALVRSVSRRRLVLIGAGLAVFAAGLAFALVTLLGKQETAARSGATKFAVALVHNDPRSAPAGGADFVDGVRDYFGAVKSARVIGSHNKGVNTGDSADTRNYFVVQMLINAKRGPAAIELAFDNHSLSSEEVTGVKELGPGSAPGLSQAERDSLARAFAARGGEPAGQERLTVAFAPVSKPVQVSAPPTSQPAAPKTPAPSAADKRLRCVHDAHGDVVKLQRCAQ